MEAIILAGGMGTRLRTVIPDLPKPMAPVGDKPFLWHLLQWLGKYKIDKIIVSAGYKSDSIVNYFGNSFKGIPLEYAIEQEPLGTGGAVRFAIRQTKGNDILILNGDTYFPIDLDRFYSFHTGNKNMFSLALKRMKDFSRYGTVECDGNQIIKFNEKKFCCEGLINGGIYIAGRNLFDNKDLPAIFSLEKDLLEKKSGSGDLNCMVFDDPFIDIGIPEDYIEAQSLFKT